MYLANPINIVWTNCNYSLWNPYCSYQGAFSVKQNHAPFNTVDSLGNTFIRYKGGNSWVGAVMNTTGYAKWRQSTCCIERFRKLIVLANSRGAAGVRFRSTMNEKMQTRWSPRLLQNHVTHFIKVWKRASEREREREIRRKRGGGSRRGFFKYWSWTLLQTDNVDNAESSDATLCVHDNAP